MECSLLIEKLRQRITDKEKKLKLLHVVWLCLQHVSNNPDDKTKIGIFWFDDSHFMLNTSIFGLFVNRKPNTMNRLFRTHGFHYQKSTSSMREKVYELYPNEALPEPKNWILRWCDGFTRTTTEDEARKWKKIDSHKITLESAEEHVENKEEELADFKIPSNVDIMDMFNPPSLLPNTSIPEYDNFMKNDPCSFDLLFGKDDFSKQFENENYDFSLFNL